MTSTSSPETAYQLPPAIVEYRDLAQRIVLERLMPLERKFLPHPGHAYGMRANHSLMAVFGPEITADLVKLSRETGFWYLMVPEQYGGMGLSLLAQAAILEQFMYCAVPFPFATVANILYECKGSQIERFLKPVIEGEKNTCFAQTEPNAGSDPRRHDANACRQGRQALGDQWHEDVDIRGSPIRLHHAAGSDRPREAPKGRHHHVPGRSP